MQKSEKFQKNLKISYIRMSPDVSTSHTYAKLYSTSFKINCSRKGQCGKILPAVTSIFCSQMTKKMFQTSSWGVFSGIPWVLCHEKPLLIVWTITKNREPPLMAISPLFHKPEMRLPTGNLISDSDFLGQTYLKTLFKK